MADDKPEDFYRSYSAYKTYQTPHIGKKHIGWYDREFWVPARCMPDMSVLELGSGPGEFLAYLAHKGVRKLHGVEMDRDAVAVAPRDIAQHITTGDIWDYLAQHAGEQWDRVVLLDVLEHFSSNEGARLLERIADVLAPGGRVVARVPNMGSPWGALYQYGDLTHKAQYSEDGLRHLGAAAGYEVDGFIPQRRGSPMRRFTDGLLHAVLDRILTVKPNIWTANIIVIYRRKA